MQFNFNGNANKAGVYKLINVKSGKFYIGSTYKFKQRWAEHRRQLESGKHTNTYLLNAFKQDDTGNFVFEILDIIADKIERLAKEQEYLNKWYDKQDNCYNLCDRAFSREGKTSKNPQLTHERIMANRVGMLGKHHTEETKEKIRLAHCGVPKVPCSEAKKLAIGKANKGRKRPDNIARNKQRALINKQ